MDRKQSFEDLIQDESFIKWVKNPDYELNLYWEQWIRHNQHRRNDVMLAKEVITRMQFKIALPDEETTKKVFNRIIDNTGKNEVRNSRKIDKIQPYSSNYHYLKIAAIFLIFLVSAGSIYLLVQHNKLYELQQSKVQRITKSNPSSVRSKIKLPDGTKVWLNAASEISYPEKFGTIREVTLKGEAYFEVVENTKIPFIVHTQSSQVKVLGTSFNVKAYDDDKHDQISLLTGKVEITESAQNETNHIVLRPGEQVIVDKHTGDIKAGKFFDRKNIVGWTEGYLSFKDATKDEIISKLERWYDVKITLKNEPAEQWHVNGHFRNQSLELVLDRLSFSKEFSYDINGKNITIDFK